MIVHVTLRVETDDGIPMLLYSRTDAVLQTDFEGNLAKAGMTMDDTIEEGRKSIQRQLRAYRDNPPAPVE